MPFSPFSSRSSVALRRGAALVVGASTLGVLAAPASAAADCPDGSTTLAPNLCQMVFVTDGVFTAPAGVTTADVLVVGGGGGGGGYAYEYFAPDSRLPALFGGGGGGGGGGDLVIAEDHSLDGPQPIQVGLGGEGGVLWTVRI